MPTARPRLLLTLLDALGGNVGNRDFQKLLFLFAQECEEDSSYDFVPFKYGGFSFTSYADRRRLIQEKFLVDDENSWLLTEAGRQVAITKGSKRLAVDRFCHGLRALRGADLIAYAYRRYPYYAIHSEIVASVLPDSEDRALVEAARPASRPPGVVTIGYEGKSLEGFLNQLLADGITLLCDVRRNPISRKYGFSKRVLSQACTDVRIRYEHIPELGIASDQRQELNSQKDYDVLFAAYEKFDLPKQTSAIERIVDWIQKHRQRVALTCFEALPEQCHRHCVAEAVAAKLRKATINHLGRSCRKNAFLLR